jgi:beta-glucosidase/6-phospho-beta-glucosidase/beta-galactosidase
MTRVPLNPTDYFANLGQEGHEARFGVTYIDYKNDCKRHPKQSATAMKEYYTSRIERE